jgi:hypothetical protein
MADDKTGQPAGARPLDLAGDSPELIAFALLRYLAQLEQQDDGVVFDRGWMLDAYAECLEAVQGNRTPRAPAAKPAPAKSASGRKR